jgi:hypothetical protein
VAPPKRKSGGRVTPKGGPAARRGVPSAGAPSAHHRDDVAYHSTSGSSRYTPPTPKEVKVSPPWLPFLMFGLLIVGALVIMLNYLELLPGATSNWYLLGGLAGILAGIMVATQYR